MARTPFVDQRISVADILASSVEDGEVRVNLGYAATGKGIGAEQAYWGLDGFFSRPNDPKPDGSEAAMALYIVDGEDKRVVASRDNRFADKVGDMQPGDRAIVTDADARVLIKKNGNSVTLYTVSEPDNTDIQVHLDGASGFLEGRCGGSWIKLTNDKVTIGAAGGKCIITVSAKGVQIDGENFICATAGGMLGVIAPMVPPPPAPAGSILFGPVGATGLPSTRWTVAP